MSKTVLQEGQSIFIQGSAKKPYQIKMTGGVISCDCPAWRNQSNKIDQRTCKHIQKNVENATVPVAATVPLALEDQAKKAAVVKETAPEVLLAHPWDGEQDLANWWISEKLDGVRAYWDGTKFITRLGNTYNAPVWFTEGFPKVPLDGELWAGRGKFQECVSVVRKMIPQDEEWKNIKFMAFDVPTSTKPFEERMKELEALVKDCSNITLVKQTSCNGHDHLKELLKGVEQSGGEGLMAREPKSLYESNRSTTLLKIKSFIDEEGKVIGHEKGKGKHKGKMGALVVLTPSGVEFKVGTGFTDKERANPPSIGSTITYRYFELTKEGVPRFPSFVSERSYE